jgi:hypothetical protein
MSYRTEQDVLARTIYGEARGESFEGQVAVGWVIRNRVEADLLGDGKPDWWGEGYLGVCLRPYQFSCWLKNDPTYAKVATATLEDPVFSRAYGIGCLVRADDLPDPTGGATHYFADTIPPPKWVASLEELTKIGHHSFFRDPAAGKVK